MAAPRSLFNSGPEPEAGNIGDLRPDIDRAATSIARVGKALLAANPAVPPRGTIASAPL